jgi:putative hemolysin
MRHSRWLGSIFGLAAILVLVAGSTGLGQSSSPWPGPVPSFDPNAALSECEEKGGRVQQRRAAWNTNADPGAWLILAGEVTLCRFQARGGDDDSRVYVDLRTLTSRAPTLAALAYLSKVPVEAAEGGANPATLHCARLGGSSSFGGGASGGGWINLDDAVDPVVAMCVFPDGSMIDEWGIAYYADGVVRGADLALAFGYQPEDGLPGVFGAG